MRGVHFRNEQRNIGVHAVIPGIADDGIARAGEILFGGASDGRIERRKNEVAVEREVEAFNDEAARGIGNRRVEVPANGFGVSSTRRTLGGGNFGKVKPRMIAEHLNETLADNACSAKDSRPPLVLRSLRVHILISVVLRYGIHSPPP